MSFNQNIALVAITAALTGVLVPTVKAIMDQHHFRKQKLYEAELARQSSVIAAQVALLDEISTALWDYMLGLIGVSYYKVNGDDARAEAAFAKYEEASPGRFGSLQAIISKARRLVSPDHYEELQELYRMLLDLDVSLLRVQQSNSDRQAWNDQHRKAFNAQKPVSDVLAHIADEMRLSV